MSKREKILQVLQTMPDSEAIALVESIGKELRKKNSVTINNRAKVKVNIDRDRPDLVELKKKK